MARGEVAEGFAARSLFLIDAQNFFEGRFELFDGNSLEELAAEEFVITEAAADEDVVAFFGFAGDFDGGGEEADVADVMLGAGVGATGEMDVDGLIESEFFLEVIGEFAGVFLGVGGGEFAVGVTGTGDEPAAEVVLTPIEAGFEDGFFDGLNVGVWDVWDEEILPGSEAKFAGGVVVGEVAEAEELLGRDFADRNGNAKPGEAGLFLGKGTDVRMRDGRAERELFCNRGVGGGRIRKLLVRILILTRRLGNLRYMAADKFIAKKFFGGIEVLREGPFFEEVFEAGPFAVGAVAMSDVNAEHGCEDFEDLRGRD